MARTCSTAAAEIVHHDNRSDDKRYTHQRSLEGIGPAHGQEAADENVQNGCGGADPERALVGHAEGVFKEAGARDDAAGAVNRKEHQNNNGRQNAQHARIVLEAVRKKVGQGERIVRNLGVDAKTRRHELPIEIGAEREADGNPAFCDARKKHGAGKPHQQPAAHVRGADREGCHDAAEAAAAQNVVAEVSGVPPGHKAQKHHQNHVAGESNGGGIGKHLFRFLVVSAPRLS